MDTKLKTLNDFGKIRVENHFSGTHPPELPYYIQGMGYIGEYEILIKQDLRQEAIKWIKSIEKQDNDSFPKFCCCDDDNGWHETTMDWIKHFFNITEEELNG